MVGEMTPWERFEAAMSLEEPDYVPVVCSMTSFYSSWFYNIPLSQFFLSPETMFKAEMAVQKRFPDIVLYPGFGPDFSIQFEPRAFGAQVKQSLDSPPWPLRVFKEPEDIEKIEVPDPRTSGLCPKCLEYYKWMRAHTDSEFRRKYGYLNGWAFYMLGPFDTAALLRGVTDFMVDLYLHPDLAKKLLDAVTEWEISWIKLQDEEIGPLRLFNVSDDNSGNVSREFFERFVFPYFKKIYDELHFIRFRQLHNDSDVRHIMDRIPDLGCNVFIAFDPKTDISEFKRIIGDRVCLVGNVDPLRVLLRGTPEDVERECRRQIKVAAPGGGYCLCSGGEISRGTPPENIDAMISAGKKYGRYPLEV